MKDKIVKQFFKQDTPMEWTYAIHTAHGKTYFVKYEVLHTGYCKETLIEGTLCIWEREFKIGEALSQTIYHAIERQESMAV